MTKEEILEKYRRRLGDKTIEINGDTIQAAMQEYALSEMINLIGNLRINPIDVYSQKYAGEGKKYFLGRQFCENLIEALKNQYS